MLRYPVEHKLALFIFVFFLISLKTVAQISYQGKPIGILNEKPESIPYIHLDDALQMELNSREETERYKIDVFAGIEHVSLNPETEGNWKIKDEALRVWRIGLTSRHASSLGISFNSFNLKPGAKVFLYTPDQKLIVGAFTFRNNKKTGVLSVHPLYGDSIIVELQLSSGTKDYGELTIGTVSIGFPRKSAEDEWYGRSDTCHLDINCINDPKIQQQKYSSCRLIIETESSRIRCTGTLLNNTREDGSPYVLTSAHCIKNTYSANHTVFYFDYESPYCNGPDGEIKSISGSQLISRGEHIDFALLKLSEKPPIDYYPLYSGWNASMDDVDSSYSIHHPEGDVKKISLEYDKAATGSFPPYATNTFWRIDKYEEGTTEIGSSGSALFDYNKQQLVGTLTGGGEACSEYIIDFYQKFGYAWDYSPEEDKQLKHWLDPENSGELEIDNLDPYMGVTTKLSNIEEFSDSDIIECGSGWGYISGHNSLGSVQFAEHYYRNGSKYIYAINMNVAVLNTKTPDSKIYLKIWDGIDEPDELLFKKELFLSELAEGNDNYIRLDTLIYVDKHFFIGYEIFYNSILDTFAIYTGTPDTLLTGIPALMNLGNGWNYLSDGEKDYEVSLGLSPLVLDYFPPANSEFGKYPFDVVTLYPNPAYDKLQILLQEKPEGIVEIRVYDLYGKLVIETNLFSPENNFSIDLKRIPAPGIYFISIENNGFKSIKKFVNLE